VAAVFGGHQVAIGPGGVAVAHHDVGGQPLAGGQLHAGGAAVLHGDAADVGVASHRHAALRQQAHEAVDQLAGAAGRPMHAETPLQRVDQAVARRHRERIAADQQRVEAEHGAQLFVAQMARHHAVDRPPGAHSQQLGHGGEEVA
jgi:hypothetical protein